MAKPLTKKSAKTKKEDIEITEEVIYGSDVVTKFYGQPGTAVIVQCEPFLVPEGYIEVTNTVPPTSFHVLDTAGDWMLPDDVHYAQLRAEAYLKAWPITKQLEAHMDAVNGDTTKLDQMKEDFAEIQRMYPKK
jgi:hypothetical protein